MTRLATEPGRHTGLLRSFAPAGFSVATGLDRSEPGVIRAPLAVLFADISGFSSLADRLGATGADGAERLTVALDTFLGALVDRVHAYGGDVIQFPGDGVIAAFTGDLAAATAAAAACALDIRAGLHETDIAGPARFGLKVAVSAGDAVAVKVGGPAGAAEVVLGGAGVTSVGRALLAAERGQVVLAAPAVALLPTARGRPTSDGHLVLEEVAGRVTVAGRSEPTGEWREFAAQPLLARLDAGHQAWLAELRWLTVGFVGLRDFDYAHADGPSRLQRAVGIVHRELAETGGMVIEVVADEKGTGVVAAFGLPTTETERREERGLIGIHESVRALVRDGFDARAGIATGKLYCGPIGNDRRRKYGLVGRTVVRAARLLGVAGAADVICDAQTLARAGRDFDTEDLGELTLKGFRQAVAAHRVLRLAPVEAQVVTSTVGRTAELAWIRQAIRRLLDDRAGSTAVFEGPAGIGKTTIATAAARIAHESGADLLRGSGRNRHSGVTLHAWEAVAVELLGVAGLEGPEAEAAARRALTVVDAERFAPLFSRLTGVPIAETPATAALVGGARGEQIRTTLVQLLLHRATTRPVVLIVDDCQWLDSASWSVLAALRAQRRIAIVLLTREIEAPPDEYLAMVGDADTHQVRLAPLGRADSDAMTRQVLGDDVDPVVLAWVHERGDGNPLMTRELARVLEESGIVGRIREGMGGHEARQALERLEVPTSIDGLVTSRIERLTARSQLVLKTASVMGYRFKLDALEAVLPVEEDRPFVADAVIDLMKAGLVDSDQESSGFVFTHRIAQVVTYSLLLERQKRDLHRAVVTWMEAESQGPPATLANHWIRAGESRRALDYVELSAIHALDGGAWREAIHFFDLAIDLVDANDGVPVGPVRRASWYRLRGEANVHGSRYDVAASDYRQALAILGSPAPSTTRGWARLGAREVLTQLWHRVRRVPFVPRLAGPDDADAERAAVLAAFYIVAYWTEPSQLALFASTFWAANQAERSGRGSHAFANLAFVMGAMRLTGWGHWYMARARQFAREAGGVREWSQHCESESAFHFLWGRWDEGERVLDEPARRSAAEGLRRMHVYITGVRCFFLRYRGDFGAMLPGWHEVFAQHSARADSAGDLAWDLAYAGSSLAITQVEVGDLPAARASLERAEVAARRVAFGEAGLSILGCRAAIAARSGEWREARECLGKAIELIGPNPKPAPTIFLTYAQLTESALALVVRERDRGDADAYALQLAERALRHLRALGDVYPVCWPRGAVYLGDLESLRGRRARAVRSWQRALAEARRLDCRLDVAMALLRLGTDAGDRAMIEEARAGFQRLGCAWYEERALDALDRREPKRIA